MPNLKILRCEKNPLTSLNTATNTAINTLVCDHCELTGLKVSHLPLLSGLSCGYNMLQTLDLTKNDSLKSLGCEGCRLTSLDLSSNHKLYSLHCYNNNLMELDIAGMDDLHWLHCENNPFVNNNEKLIRIATDLPLRSSKDYGRLTLNRSDLEQEFLDICQLKFWLVDKTFPDEMKLNLENTNYICNEIAPKDHIMDFIH